MTSLAHAAHRAPAAPKPAQDLDQLDVHVRRVAPLDCTILLGGETGTGKTRLARQIHHLSPRRHDPFLTVNCGALSETLIESEMFGHVRGAFTGADRDRTGKFAEVGRGTLFLDDVDLLPVALQAKLLRVVEERVFEPVGSNKSQPMTARLIAASNRDLQAESSLGRFRSDLYYRLNVVSFRLPCLRERSNSIVELALAFTAELAGRHGRDRLTLSDAALDDLQAYHWPGNVRELRNVIERAVTLAAGPIIDRDDLPEPIRRVEYPRFSLAFPDLDGAGFDPPSVPSHSLAQVRGEAEATRIVRALERNHNNRLRAAAELGISRMTLYKKLHKYGLMEEGGHRYG